MRSIHLVVCSLSACLPVSPSPGSDADGSTTAGVGGSSSESSSDGSTSASSGDASGSDGAVDGSTGAAPVDCGLPGLADLATTPGPYAVTTIELDLVDRTRPTPPHERFEGSAERALPTTVWLPVDANEPMPLVIYSHGMLATPLDEAYLTEAWARWGFVVAAPAFPATGANAPGGANAVDVVQQPGDLAFVLDALANAVDDPRSPLFQRIDLDAVALAGLSLGALGTLLALDDPPPGVRAAVLMATPACFWPAPPLGSGAVATMALHGDADTITPFEEHARPLFDHAPPGSFVVRIERGTHTAFSGVAGPGTRGVVNADELGCDFLGAFPELWPELGAAVGGDASQCSLQCSTPMPWVDSISAAVQTQVAIALSLVHLQRTLRACEDAETLWSVVVDGDATGVEVL